MLLAGREGRNGILVAGEETIWRGDNKMCKAEDI